MPKVFTSESQKIGELGEDIACRFLMKHGFSVIERNYTKKWGEIDIIARDKQGIHFIEVKAVSRKGGAVSQETSDRYKPEDNIHPWKVQRLSRVIQTYLLERKVPENENWQFDICAVYLDMIDKKAIVKMSDNIIL